MTSDTITIDRRILANLTIAARRVLPGLSAQELIEIANCIAVSESVLSPQSPAEPAAPLASVVP